MHYNNTILAYVLPLWCLTLTRWVIAHILVLGIQRFIYGKILFWFFVHVTVLPLTELKSYGK